MSSFIHEEYPVEKGDYTRAGEASADIKRRLKQLGVSSTVFPDAVRLVSSDVGPGIPDLEMAMREGFSTANEEARSMGFGAGMGLPNMKRNADDFDIQSEMGKGTRISMRFNLA